jgi:phage recombination protein Bet
MAQQAVAIAPRLAPPVDFKGTPGQWRVLCEAIWPNAKSADAIALAVSYCAARRLDPMKRPVHIVPMWNSTLGREVETVWPGINELLTTASRSGGFAGVDEPRWGPDETKTFRGTRKVNGKEVPAEVTVTFPVWCSVTVWRIVGGQRVAYSLPVYWIEAYGRLNFRSEVPNDMWAKRPRGQFQKVALAASLRVGFPEDIGGEMSAEEMEGGEIGSGGFTIEAAAERSVENLDRKINAVMDDPHAGEPAPADDLQPRHREVPQHSIDAMDTGGPSDAPDGPGDYRIALPSGGFIYENSIDWLAGWDKLLDELKDRPNDLRALRAMNRRELHEAGEINEAAARDVETRLARLLDDTNGRRPTR